MGETPTPEDHARAQHDQPEPAAPQPRCVRSIELLAGGREMHIRHGDDTYRLILTRNGKLILQK